MAVLAACGSAQAKPTPIQWKTPAPRTLQLERQFEISDPNLSSAETPRSVDLNSESGEFAPSLILNLNTVTSVDPRSTRIRDYFHGLPLADIADVMVSEADREGVDWRVAPVIGMLESTGGLHACDGNAYGIASCRVWYQDFEAGTRVAIGLLSQPPYRDLPIEGKFCTWVNGGHWPDCAEYVGKAMGELARLGER